jgi:hypothetical protein
MGSTARAEASSTIVQVDRLARALGTTLAETLREVERSTHNPTRE